MNEDFERYLGVFVCDALNRLPHPDDLTERKDFVEEMLCCQYCCAPCAALFEMDQNGILNHAVKQAPPHLWKDGISWMKDDKVNREWLYACWTREGCCNELD